MSRSVLRLAARQRVSARNALSQGRYARVLIASWLLAGGCRIYDDSLLGAIAASERDAGVDNMQLEAAAGSDSPDPDENSGSAEAGGTARADAGKNGGAASAGPAADGGENGARATGSGGSNAGTA